MKNLLYTSCLAFLFVFSITVTKAQQLNQIYIDSLKQELNIAKADTNKVDELYYLSWVYMWSFADTAVAYAQKGLEIAKKTGDKEREAECMSALCYSLTVSGNFTSALDFGFKASKIYESLHDTVGLVNINLALEICYRDQGDYSQALVYGYKAKKLFELAKFSWNPSILLGNISSIYEKKNQLDSALYYGNKSFELNKEWSGILQTMGNIHAKLKHPELALEYYRRGIVFATQQFFYRDLIDIYNGMSKVFNSINKIDSSIYYANKSITQNGIKTFPEGALQASLQLANLYEVKGMNDSAIKYLKLTNALKDSLFSQEKTREAQNFAFNEKYHQQQLSSQQQEDGNRLKMYALFLVIMGALSIAFILWRNNQHKQKAYTLLKKQKQETDIQKNKVEDTLSALKSTQAQLIQSEKMASLGELTAGIAHEIQNPLNFVNNFSEVNKELLMEMKEEIDKGDLEEVKLIVDDVISNEEKISHHGKRADSIVKGMLQHSRASTGKNELVDINALLHECLRLSFHGMRAKDKEFNAGIKTDLDESIGKVNVVPQDINRVLINLLNNAFYAVDEKKRQLNGMYEPAVAVCTKKLDGKVEIQVRDNGNGIPQSILDKIFQPFFTTKPTGQGTGLGLSLSYDIIKAHGGEIKVESKEGGGTEFIVKLPN